MQKKVKIAWDISHLEFTIEDHYYFSILKSEIKEAGGVVREVDSFEKIVDYDVAVLNYPEKPFKRDELKLVKRYLEEGGRVIIAGYYNNEDRIADRINSLSTHFGLFLNNDKVKDKSSNDEGDDLLVVASRILSYSDSVEKVLFPCSASINILRDSGRPIVIKESHSDSARKTVIGAEVSVGKGRFILLGTCVFWDNFAIRKYSNLRFSLNLLLR
ncbi:MAG: hypothetical protein HYW01_01765 [Deltaproteobacteria bacterium]|nr:hypothetical protein [Deltaproteobacteria bacterium]